MHEIAVKWIFTFDKSKDCPDFAARWYELFEKCFSATIELASAKDQSDEEDDQEQDTGLLSCCAQVVVALCLQRPEYTEFFVPLLMSFEGDEFYANPSVWTMLEKIVPSVPQDKESVRDSIVDSILQVAGAVLSLPVEKFDTAEKKKYALALDRMGNCLLAVAKNHGSAFKQTLSTLDPYEQGTLQKILRSKLA